MYIERFYKQFVEPFPSWLWEQATHNRVSRSAQYIQNTGNQWTKQYMESPWNFDKYQNYLQLKNNPITGYFIGLYESSQDSQSYLDTHDIDWSKVTRPWKLPGSNVSSAGSVFRYVSKNIEELYR